YLFWRNREDNRELMQQKELAEQNARYKTRFLANMSHEIRTPMNAILGLSRLLTESKLPPKQSEYADAIRQSSEHLLVIINDVLDQVKIESGKFTFQQKPFDLDWIVKHLENTLGFKAEEKGLSFAIQVAPGTPLRLIGDPVRLNQILTNLLGNAIKFTEKGKVELLIEATETPEVGAAVKIGFTVVDTGIGIAPEQLPRVFESFQQADDDISAQYGGTGLGLSITKDLVEQQGGTITMESEPGMGTCIRVVLSFLPDDSSVDEIVPVESRPYDFGAIRILLVEDTFFNQMLAIELLQQRIPEAQIEVAENGQVALEKMDSAGPYDLVLMDVKMPVMDGLEATRRIRSNPKWATLPIIALTANAVQEELEKCRVAGMDAWVTKPIDAPELFATMEKVVRE
ncbi:MAG: response regulator, partial [Saprospiraceae bacterium]|nr:response regulator [Saprospiraceae bacterium]